jgi:hypothetical protein
MAADLRRKRDALRDFGGCSRSANRCCGHSGAILRLGLEGGREEAGEDGGKEVRTKQPGSNGTHATDGLERY